MDLLKTELRPATSGWRDKFGLGNRGIGLSDEVVARLGAGLLWLLVILAALGGIAAWLRPTPAPPTIEATSPEDTVSSGWAAAGFAERFVSAYLTASSDNEGDLSRFLGYSPDLPATVDPAQPPGPVSATAVDSVGEGYWAVTVAAGAAGAEQFWQVAVAIDDGHMVVTGLPTPVGAPPVGERPNLAVNPGALPSSDDPMVQTVEGFATAYMCGQGGLDRYLAPGAVTASLAQPLCSIARLDRWGSADLGENRQRVVTEVLLDPGTEARRVTLWLELARRDGRWEIAELSPAPPRADDPQQDQEVEQ